MLIELLRIAMSCSPNATETYLLALKRLGQNPKIPNAQTPTP